MKAQYSESRADRRAGMRLKRVLILHAVLLVVIALFAGSVSAKSLVVMAKKVTGALPLDPADGLWTGASSISIPLTPQVMAKPRLYESKIRELSVKALHNTKEIAFLIEWPDATEDVTLDFERALDAVALEFPSSAAAGKPHFAMGDKENTVNIWYWRASSQKQTNGERTYAASDDFAGGVLASNPLSKPQAAPIENIVALGFGSATNMNRAESQNISGKGTWRSGRWSVVMKRALTSPEKFDANFREGGVTPVAFAVWDGADGQSGSKKSVSTWYYVGIETEEKKTLYLYPVIGLIAAAGIEAGIIFGIRKRRKR